ncbi:hypothetical protein Y032_0030g2197 [Ancylostoma ceylanicum]|uniref:Uncharacterized protein n=1 Tax=Ancylostoma ceylanicum TaxID=53326 RepID=A0A016UR47_9BILA|nr:hypothetical protein Y032_0030g2197 [Ancylostoma ceylanicum]
MEAPSSEDPVLLVDSSSCCKTSFQVHSSRQIQIEVMNGVMDNQLVLFRACDIIMPAPNVTAKAINWMILEWFERKREINCIHLKQIHNVTKMDILGNVEVVPWQKFLTIIQNGVWWSGWSSENCAGLYNGINFLIVIVDVDSCQLIDPHYRDE